jgi:prolyl 4-hydroxylase
MNLLQVVVLLSIGTISLLNIGECLALEQTTEGSCTNDDPGTCGDDQIVTDTDTPEEVHADGDDSNDDGNDSDDGIDCQDEHPKCFDWSRIGECDANPVYMLRSCSRSCKQCPDQAEELAAILAAKAKKVKVYTKEELMIGEDMGEPQSLEDSEFRVSEKETIARIEASRQYLQDSDFDDDLIEICLNKHEKCFTWAVAGECEKNKKYMISSCAPACMTCDKLTIESRCPIDPGAKAAWESGSLNAMFERLTSEPITTQYNVTILSSPPEPWVVIVDGVVTEEESKHMIELGDLEGFKRSQDVGAKNPDGTYGSIVSTGRTSTNAWCNENCYKDPVAAQVQKKLSDLTMINETNSEYLQLLK